MGERRRRRRGRKKVRTIETYEKRVTGGMRRVLMKVMMIGKSDEGK